MKVKINTVAPDIYKRLDKVDFSKWTPYSGMTEEQEEFYRKTYMDYLMSPKKSKTKNIYLFKN